MVNPEVDEKGHMVRRSEWTEAWAVNCTEQLGYPLLTSAHWSWITLVQSLFHSLQRLPPQRVLLKAAEKYFNQGPISTLNLYKLFPDPEGNPLRCLALLAGLPPPTHCL